MGQSSREPSKAVLLSIIELGDYPDFTPRYQQAGYEVVEVDSVRKAISTLKKVNPKVVVAEFNFQSDFRDRTSSLESLLAVLQRMEINKVIVFYDADFSHQFEKLQARFPFIEALTYPIKDDKLTACLNNTG